MTSRGCALDTLGNQRAGIAQLRECPLRIGWPPSSSGVPWEGPWSVAVRDLVNGSLLDRRMQLSAVAPAAQGSGYGP